jgi:hypothetical protein
MHKAQAMTSDPSALAGSLGLAPVARESLVSAGDGLVRLLERYDRLAVQFFDHPRFEFVRFGETEDADRAWARYARALSYVEVGGSTELDAALEASLSTSFAPDYAERHVVVTSGLTRSVATVAAKTDTFTKEVRVSHALLGVEVVGSLDRMGATRFEARVVDGSLPTSLEQANERTGEHVQTTLRFLRCPEGGPQAGGSREGPAAADPRGEPARVTAGMPLDRIRADLAAIAKRRSVEARANEDEWYAGPRAVLQYASGRASSLRLFASPVAELVLFRASESALEAWHSFLEEVQQGTTTASAARPIVSEAAREHLGAAPLCMEPEWSQLLPPRYGGEELVFGNASHLVTISHSSAEPVPLRVRVEARGSTRSIDAEVELRARGHRIPPASLDDAPAASSLEAHAQALLGMVREHWAVLRAALEP